MKNIRIVALSALTLALLVPMASAQDRAFTARHSTNLRGDITLVGNTVVTCPPGGPMCEATQRGEGTRLTNNSHDMVYVDIDADATTYNSSSADLSLPRGSDVVFAALYWGGKDTGGDTGGAAFDGDRTTCQMRRPGGTYQTVSAVQTDIDGEHYQSIAVVTDLVQAGGNGTYFVGNVYADSDDNEDEAEDGARSWGGWSLVVVYENLAEPTRNLVVYDGVDLVTTESGTSGTPEININVSGFITPRTGPVNTKIGIVVFEGDLGLEGDFAELNGTRLGDALNPTDNLFNSAITLLGTRFSAKNPDYINQLAFDAGLFDATGVLGNDATSATIRLTTTRDTYWPAAVTFSTELFTPQLDATKELVDINGGRVKPGDELEYIITATNNGQDAAIDVVLEDEIPEFTTYVAGSLQITSGPGVGALTDAVGDDAGEYVAVDDKIVVRLGSSATGTMGGRLTNGESVQLRFRVRIADAVPQDTMVTNQATFTYRGETLDMQMFTGASDGDPVTPGVDPTITMTMPGCSTDEECTDPGRPVCDTTTALCEPCVPGVDETLCELSAAGPECLDTGAGYECGCDDDADCGGTRVCNLDTNTCIDGPGEDSDDDGTPNDEDADADNDGIPDVVESGGMDPSRDTDGDGIPDYADSDTPGFIDGNGDGIDDRFDRDQDGVPNHLDLDSDNDGIPDLWENGSGALDGNRDGRIDDITDLDGDGLVSSVDADDNNPAETNSTVTPKDTDTDGVIDIFDLDDDADGITDIIEAGGFDTDGDGRVDGFTDPNGNGYAAAHDVADGGDPLPLPDTDMDGEYDFQDVDSDGDGVPDDIEGHDTNADGVADAPRRGTDIDADGLDDAYDTSQGGLPAATPNRDQVGFGMDNVPDYRDLDDDGDLLDTAIEDLNGDGNFANDDTDSDGTPNYLDPDDDGDGLNTADEVTDAMTYGDDVDMDGEPNWLDVDSDGDMLLDANEGRADVDGDGIPNYLDPIDDGGEPVPPIMMGMNDGFSGGALCATSLSSSASNSAAGLTFLLVLGLLGVRRRR